MGTQTANGEEGGMGGGGKRKTWEWAHMKGLGIDPLPHSHAATQTTLSLPTAPLCSTAAPCLHGPTHPGNGAVSVSGNKAKGGLGRVGAQLNQAALGGA